jgi:hypothetical protein
MPLNFTNTSSSSIGGGGYGQNIASYGATGAKSLEASALAAQAISVSLFYTLVSVCKF